MQEYNQLNIHTKRHNLGISALSHILQRSLLNTPLKAVSGEGVYITDSDGKQYLDACGGAAISILGHNNRKVINAIKQAKLPTH